MSIKCSNCGCDMENGAKFCPKCGSKQETVCPNCGAKIYNGDVFCGNCGINLETEGKFFEQNTSGVWQELKNRVTIVGALWIIAGVMLVISGLVILLIYC